MKTSTRYVLSAIVFICSITCQTLTGGISPQLDEAALAEGEKQLQALIEKESAMGELNVIDYDTDGKVDQIQYQYPEKIIEADVTFKEMLTYTSGQLENVPDPSAYYPILFLKIENQSQQEKRIQFIYEIPKDFAQYVNEVSFNPAPTEIINPDIVVMYDLVLPAPSPDSGEAAETGLWMSSITAPPIIDYILAKARLRMDALKQMKERCKAAAIEDKNDCYLSLISDFRDILDVKEMEKMCSGEMTGVERRICLSIAKDSAKECDKAATPQDTHICKGFYVSQKCKELDGGELQACLRDTAIANKAPLGCKDLEDPDVRNECYAKASGNAKYCARINNQARRTGCEQALNIGSGSGSINPKNWFMGDKAKSDCQFYNDSLPLYTLYYSKGDYFHDIATLACQMNSTDQYGNLYDGSVWIWAYDSPETARSVWETDETDGYTYASLKQQQEINADPNFTIIFGTDNYLNTFKIEHSDRPPTYIIKGGSLYKNARIAILYRDIVDTPTTWTQIEMLFKQMIDQKLKGG